jgi:hypothetical protein
LDMHSSSLNRGLLMAAMELLPTVYCKTQTKKKKETLNNKKTSHQRCRLFFPLALVEGSVGIDLH